MVGIIVLILAITSYICGNKKVSLLIYLFLISGFFGLMPLDILGIKCNDILFVYTFIICIYSHFFEPYYELEDSNIGKYIRTLFLFLICSALFSYIHYNLSFFQIIQGGRNLFLFLGYFFIRKTNKDIIVWLFRWMYYLTLLTSILYILEVATGLPFLPSAFALENISVDKSTGINRFYNSPLYLPLFIYVSILTPQLIRDLKFNKIAPFVFCVAQLATLGRTEIIVVVMILLIGFLLHGQVDRIVRYTIIGFLFLLPFMEVIINRFEINNMGSDIENIINLEFIKKAKAGDMDFYDATMTYRFAWLYERVDYLYNRPVLENVFGLGMLSDSQEEIVNRMYRFYIGLESDGHICQLYTPDLAYGNILVQMGYCGGFIYIGLWISIIIYLYRNRNISPYIFVIMLLGIGYMFRSLSGSMISNTKTLNIFFLFMALIPQLKFHKNKYQFNKCKHAMES